MKREFKSISLLLVLLTLSFLSYSQDTYDVVRLEGSYVKATLAHKYFVRFKFRYFKDPANGHYVLAVRPYYKTGIRGPKKILTSHPSLPGSALPNQFTSNTRLHLKRSRMEEPAINMDGSCEFYVFTPQPYDPTHVAYKVTGENCQKEAHGAAFGDFILNPSPPAPVPFH